MSKNTVCLSPDGRYLRREALANVAGILPGHLLGRLGTGKVVVHPTAEGKASVLRIADVNVGDAGDMDRAYTADETVHYVELAAGQYVHLRLTASQNIAIEDELTSAGNGQVKEAAAAGVGVLFIADEAVVTGVGEEAIIRAIVANH